jgi:hypothetical protein
MQHGLLLVGRRINSVAVVHDESHAVNSNTETVVYKPMPVADFTGIDRINSAGECPCIPRQICILWRGTYSLPQTPTVS